MKTVFIPVESKRKFNSNSFKEIENSLPKRIAIVYSSQFKILAKEIKEKLQNKEILSFIQVLGCSNPKLPPEVEAVLIIGEGKFHSVGIAYESGLPTYIFEDNGLKMVSDAEIEKLEKKEKGKYLKYLNAENVGILISTKPGQQRLKKSFELSKKMRGKKVYYFVSNNINANEFENFKIDSWVNTACPRMDFNDVPIINLEKLNL